MRKLPVWGKRRLIYHSLFWVVYVLFMAVEDLAYHPIYYHNLVTSLISTLGIIGVVYLNLYFLIPRLLLKKKYSPYAASLLPLIGLSTYLSTRVLGYVSSDFFPTWVVL